tara:strand:- start:319 stop:588 length:270 start_codon:yes stop_codon:yes gene_type:complete
MEKKIVFKTKDGGVAVITTAPNILAEINPDTGKLWTYEDIAKKDVPSGYKYKIIDVTDVSADRSFRDAWTVDEADLTDGTGADYGVTEE